MRNLPLIRLFFGVPPMWQGLLLAALGNSIFAHMDILVKLAGPKEAGFGLLQVMFGRAVFALPPILLLYWLTPRTQRRITRPGLHVIRIIIGIFAMGTTFSAYMLMPVAEAYAILFACPLLVALLAIPILKEPASWQRLSLVMVGFAGVLLIVAARFGHVSLGTIMCLLSVMGNAALVLIMRFLSRTESTGTVLITHTGGIAVFSILALLLMPLIAPAFPDVKWVQALQWRAPDLSGWLLLIGIGLTGGTALMLLVPSYRRLPAAVSASFDYSELLWAVLYGWLIWQTIPGATVFAGCALVIGAGVAMLRFAR